MDSFPRLVMSFPEEFEIVENNEEELEDGYGGGAVGSDFTMCKGKAKTCKSNPVLRVLIKFYISIA